MPATMPSWDQFAGLNQATYWLNNDLIKATIALALVFCMLTYVTASPFVAACGMFEVVISFPIGLFVWHVLCGQPYAL